jgi:hypothetical protein
MNKELQLQEKFDNLDSILNEVYKGKVSDAFIQLVDETKEEIKNKKQLFEKLTSELALEIDKAFDEYIEGK